ncbi:MAG: anaerobic ribonucleoside-triphosphate reductase, partial [Candidatus Lokiarchaeia archaeon]|nr:anaerobic ribonucleoside-triphosphate reductase [Candidatus Lokiarchaeia archaeon]
PFSQMWDPRLILKYGVPPIEDLNGYYKFKPALNLKSALYQLNKWLEFVQNEFYGHQGLLFFSNFLGPYLSDLSEGDLIKEIQCFIYRNNLSSLTIGRTVCPISILSSYTIFNGLRNAPAITSGGKIQDIYENYQDKSTQFFKAFLLSVKEIRKKNPNLSLPKHYIVLDSNFINSITEIFPNSSDEKEFIVSSYLLNLSPKSYEFENLEYLFKEKFHNYGILQNICLNLPRYAFISKDEDKFLELLRSKLNLCSKILLKKFEIIKKRINLKHLPLCGNIIDGEPLFKLENQGLSVSIVGLNEAVKYLTNFHLHENLENIEFGKKILKTIHQFCQELSEKHKKKFVLSEYISKRAINRFSLLDLKNFSKEVKSVSNNNIYTNSIHFRKDAIIDLLEKVKVQGIFHEFIDTGAISYISLNELKTSELTIKEFLTKISKEINISTLKFTFN